MAKSKAQKVAEAAVKKAGGRRLPGRGRFSAVSATKKEAKKQDGKK
jgi:hypothetical protein